MKALVQFSYTTPSSAKGRLMGSLRVFWLFGFKPSSLPSPRLTVKMAPEARPAPL